MNTSRLASVRLRAALLPLVLCSAPVALAGCSNGSSGPGFVVPGAANAEVLGFTIDDFKGGPATLALTLRDAESDDLVVRFKYEVNGVEHDAVMDGQPQELVLASAPGPGVTHVFSWTFANAVDLGPQLTQAVIVWARIEHLHEQPIPGTNAVELDLGNDPPVVVDANLDGFADGVVPAGEAVGAVDVEFLLQDSSGDPTDVVVEFAIVDGLDLAGGQLPAPGAWSLATLFGPSLNGVATAPAGVPVDLQWDSAEDLPGVEHEVVLRFTPDDGVVDGSGTPIGLGAPQISASFRVDNNAGPTAALDGAAIVDNRDRRRGIPIPFVVSDPEGDTVEVIFQWRRLGDAGFPALPTEVSGLSALLADPAARDSSQIATEFATWVGGRLGAVGADTARLPELAERAAAILSQGLLGRRLELLRASRRPQGVAATWSANPLTLPGAVLPLGDGRTALVLDLDGLSGWSLREIELATGAVVAELATGPEGLHAGLALEPGGASVLVAVGDNPDWRVLRVPLDGSGATDLVDSNDGAGVGGTVRGLACLGTETAVVTAGTSLVHLSYPAGGPPVAVPAVTGLAKPWGVVADPLMPGRLYVAEHDGPPSAQGRVLAVDLDAAGGLLVVAELAGSGDEGFTKPRGLAVAQGGAQLLAVVDELPVGGPRELRGVNLGGPETGEVFTIVGGLPAGLNAVATGADNLVVLAVNDFLAPDLAVGGGLLQSREIVAYEGGTQTVTVDAPFDPLPGGGVEWRVSRALGPIHAAPGGTAGVFVWDSSDLVGGGEAILRAVPMDTDLGAVEDLAGAKEIRAPLDVAASAFALAGAADGVTALAAADLDGDGDLDAVAADTAGDALVVLAQDEPGSFSPMAGSPLLLAAGAQPAALATGDLDGDGRADVVSADAGNGTLSIFFQTAGGLVADPNGPLDALPGGGGAPVDVVAADLDGDGALDLAVANQGAGNVSLLYNDGAGGFTHGAGTVGDANLVAPSALAVADLDGDGRLDLAVADAGSDDLTLFFQKTPGSFMVDPLGPLVGPATSGPRDVVAVDLDGDGDRDLVLANELGSDLELFLQSLPGEFVAHADGPLGGVGETDGVRAVTAADVDGDGRVDLIAANALGDTLALFVQDELGSFADLSLVLGDAGTTGSASAVVAADLDGDGDQDLATLHRDAGGDALVAFLQRGAGFMEASPDGPLGDDTSTKGPVAVEAGDLDRDGDLDLIAVNGSGSIALFVQVRPGFYLEDLVNGPLQLPFAGTPTAGRLVDLDGDTDLDIAITTTSQTRALALFWQVAPGQFVFDPGGPLLLPGANPQPVGIAAGDLDGDGDVDLAVASDGTDQVVLFLQGAPGVFAQGPNPPLGGPALVLDLVALASGDLDGDGDRDLVVASDGSDSLRVFFRTTPGSFAAGAPIPLNGAGAKPIDIAVADLDADGDLDLACADIAGDLELFFQGPAGQFTSAGVGALGGGPALLGPASVTTADLDRDGDQDLIGGFASNAMRVFRQASPGRFELVGGQPGGGASPLHPGALQALDLDGDGDPDFVSANLLGDDLTIVFGSH